MCRLFNTLIHFFSLFFSKTRFDLLSVYSVIFIHAKNVVQVHPFTCGYRPHYIKYLIKYFIALATWWNSTLWICYSKICFLYLSRSKYDFYDFVIQMWRGFLYVEKIQLKSKDVQKVRFSTSYPFWMTYTVRLRAANLELYAFFTSTYI